MASSGTIITHVYTSRIQIPVQGATVAFTQRSTAGRHSLLAVRVSDENGKTSPVRVSTPALGASLTPGTEAPFALCDIWVESPGYEMLLVQDAQVFPYTETLQELELIPLPEQATPTERAEQVQITPQEL